MRRVLHVSVAAALLWLLGSTAGLAQGVNVIGAVTPGHCVSFFSTSQIQDAGSACGGGGGGGVTSVTGTTGQITVTPTTGAVVVSLPATITANLTLSGTVNNTGIAQVNGVPLGTFATANFATPPAIGGTTPAAGAFSTLSATGPLTTNVTGAGSQCLQASSTGIVSGTGSACAGGGGTPGGANTNIQFNNASAFGGDAGFTYAGNGQVTHALGTITTNLKALTITGTWNNVATTFDAPLFMNIVNNASAPGSLLADLQVGSATKFSVDAAGHVLSTGGYSTSAVNYGIGAANNGLTSSGANIFIIVGTPRAVFDSSDLMFALNVDWGVAWVSSTVDAINPDTSINRHAAGTIGLHNFTTTSPAALQVYNTADARSSVVTNYERGVFDWTTTANTLTIGTQAGGTGTNRPVALIAANGTITIGSLTGAAATQLVLYGNGAGAGNRSFLFADNGTPYISVTQLGTIGWSNSADAGAFDAGVGRAAAKVVKFVVDNSGTLGGWMQWGGEARVTSDFSVTSSTALVNVTGLTVNVAAGRTYQFATELYVTDAAAGGVQAAIAGTATATNIQYTGFTIADNAIKGKTNATALATAVGSTVTTETAGIIVRITGTITVNAAGTLTVQMAQNTSNGTATIAKRGSWLLVNDMP